MLIKIVLTNDLGEEFVVSKESTCFDANVMEYVQLFKQLLCSMGCSDDSAERALGMNKRI